MIASSFICAEYSFISPLASVIRVVTCSRVTPELDGWDVLVALELVMVVSALARVELTQRNRIPLSSPLWAGWCRLDSSGTG
jgi:hypothetical protein